MFNDHDISFMKRALQLARLGGVSAAPNPMVGAVIVHNDKIIGEGYHQKYGGPHAEVNAVNSVEDQTVLSSCTIYVTLEPCAHQGKTPPCSDLIVKHSFSRVVIGCIDSFAKVSGKGIEKMKKAGIQVDVGLLETEARSLNKRFFTFHEKGRPYVILKWAQTEDGFIDRSSEERQEGVNWITTPLLKPTVHKWRSQEQAILVGWKTIKNDDSSLTVRAFNGTSPHRFIVDPNCNTPRNAKVLTDGEPCSIFVKSNKFGELPKNIEIIVLENFSSASILSSLHRKNVLSVFIEGGANTLNHFIKNNLWDEARILEGTIQFNKGLKAPRIDHSAAQETEMIGGNKISYLYNR